MEEKEHRRFILNSCCLCFSVETGAKIIGYLGFALFCASSIFNVITVISVVPNQTTAPYPHTITSDDVNGNPMNLTNDVNANFTLYAGYYEDTRYALVLTVIFLMINAFNASSCVVMLVGLHKRVKSFIRFGLIVGVLNMTVAYVLSLSILLPYPSLPNAAVLLCLVVPLYLLLVIRSAYYDMLENEVIKPIYVVVQPLEK